jgi:hypothetical protein
VLACETTTRMLVSDVFFKKNRLAQSSQVQFCAVVARARSLKQFLAVNETIFDRTPSTQAGSTKNGVF